MNDISPFVSYIELVFFPILIIISFFILFRPNNIFRIIIYIFCFIFIRDSMTPCKIWSIGSNGLCLWIRFVPNSIILYLFSFFSVFIIFFLFKFDKENKLYIQWFTKSKFIGIIVGFLSSLLIDLPNFILYIAIPKEKRGGYVSKNHFIPLLIFSLFGNLLEEFLFRGYVFGLIHKTKPNIIAGFHSGFLFCLCHIFLATSVTSIGLPIILFTFWEGIILGIIGSFFGIIPSTIAHGMAIFYLSSGLI